MTPPVKVVHFLPIVGNSCVACNLGKHPLYSCHMFKSMSHDQMVSLLKTHNFCLNCFKSGYFVKQCSSLHRCRKCQGLHHTLLHTMTSGCQSDSDSTAPPKLPPTTVSHVATGLKDNTLLMTCHFAVKAPNGLSTELARGLLDSASLMSFVFKQLAQCLCLPHTQQAA